MVRRCMREAQGFGVVLIREGREVGPAETYDVGTMAKIVDFHQLSDGLLGLSCVGEQRFRILSRSRQADGLNLAEVDALTVEPAVAVPARHARLAALLKSVSAGAGGACTRTSSCAWTMRLGSVTAWPKILPIPPADKQACLEMDDPIGRLDVLGPHARGS